MKVDNHETDESVFIIAEIGNNHEGNVEVAKRMISAAAKARVNAVKFQTLRPEGLVQSKEKARVEILKRFELSYQQFENLAKTAADEGLMFLSTPFDLEACNFLNDLVPVFKVASGDNTFYPLLERIASFGKPVILSTGLAELNEIEKAKALFERIWERDNRNTELALLHCVTSYPTPASEANLRVIQLLQEKFGGCVGYSDHTLGITAAISSVALGARIIEKHFTLDKNYSAFRDHQLSADPLEMAELVKGVRELELLLGSGEKSVRDLESTNMIGSRRSISVNKDLPKGHVLRWEDLCWLRPGNGIQPGSEDLVVGKKITENLSQGTMLSESIIE